MNISADELNAYLFETGEEVVLKDTQLAIVKGPFPIKVNSRTCVHKDHKESAFNDLKESMFSYGLDKEDLKGLYVSIGQGVEAGTEKGQTSYLPIGSDTRRFTDCTRTVYVFPAIVLRKLT